MPKVILISGGSDGLGKAMAEKLAPDNRVVILSHNREKLQAVARELNCDFVEAELTDYDSLQSAVNQIIEKHETVDVLINNAGIWMEGELDDNDPQKIKELIDVNTTGTIFLTRAVLPGMRFRKSGQIINIISQDGLCAKKARSVYHASKWAITGFTKCIQEDVAEENVKITGVFPGLIKTNLFQKSGVNRDLSEAMDPLEVASLVKYVINFNENSYIPEVCINNKNKTKQKMDDSSSPAIDLNIDPDMITPQNDSPQAVFNQAPAATPNPGVIDITPGNTATTTPTPPVADPVATPVFTAPEFKPIDLTPPATQAPEFSHLSEATPAAPQTPPVSVPTPIMPEPVFTEPTPIAETTSLTPSPEQPVEATPAPMPETTQSSPLAEDPDLVKLVK